MAAAAEKYSGVVSISDVLNVAAVPTGSVAKILEEVFHSDEGADDADLDNDDGWIDLGTENPKDKQRI